jgi:predicted nuclease of predicted toxin-antitoxin system
MGVDQRVVEWLRGRGHDASHLRDERLHRLADEKIFAKAVAEKRVVLTFDLDFGEIAAFTKGKPASVILFRLHNTRTPNVIRRLDAVLTDSAEALDNGAVVIVEESRRRIRSLPIGSTRASR